MEVRGEEEENGKDMCVDEMALALAKKGGWIGGCCVTCDTMSE